MGIVQSVAGALVGNGANVVKEAAEVFRVNADEADQRSFELQRAVLEEFAHEFANPKRSFFDTLIDGMNRLPRPLMALGTVFLAVSAMVDPVWFAARMQGVALVPEPLWWLLGAIISFYFGARYQAKGQEFQRSIAESMALAPVVVRNLDMLRALSDDRNATAKSSDAPIKTSGASNPALAEWRADK
ncbi:Methionine synthase I, cobalamin-binding domain [Rhodovulum sp. P5]|uniref:holin family protein n=1 Tax=Rhodovulum sp. P5 TaxID=1564506 RepID=UPI0009C2E67F|nr:holin family protein [Rhodovulum sp. P5]ARE42231.1 Methionine synthase I, cobalamin-binding domain [Rhodovulum sp. P5]